MAQALPIELMCTIWADRHGAYDSLGSDTGTEAWLAGLGDRRPCGTAVPTGNDRVRLQSLRDAVRRVAAHITSDTRDRAQGLPTEVRAAIDTLNATAAATVTALSLRLRSNGFIDLSPDGEDTTDTLLAALAVDAIEFLGSARSAELRTCEAPGCVLYFIKDHPRREWCSPACGNRARAARHYARHGRSEETGA